MAFEAFSRLKNKKKVKRGRRKSKPTVTILKQGNLNISTGAMELFGPKPPAKIVLMFDPEAKLIGLKPARKSNKEAYNLRVLKGSGQVSGRAFLNHFSIPFGEKSCRYPASWNDEKGMLVISIETEA
jgi:hypothetical protein